MKTADITVCAFSLGSGAPDPFARFVPRFYEAILKCDPMPAEVLVSRPDGNASGIDAPPGGLPAFRVITTNSGNATDHVAALLEDVRTRWVTVPGLDDLVMPQAFVDIAAATEAGAGWIIGKCYEGGVGCSIRGRLDPRRLATGGVNDIAPNSPFTVEAWRQVGGWDDVWWHDWVLWLRFVKAGIKTFETHHVGLMLDIGHDHVTRSGVQMPGEQRRMAMTEVQKVIDELWPGGYQ